jgi:dihydroflavonol-4-reductase
MPRAAFVTGGTGFVGLNLVQRLMAEGWDVTALHRPTSNLGFLRRFGPRLALGAVTDKESLIDAIPEGTDTVFHVAGNTNMWRQRNAEQTKDNVEGTRNIVEAAIAKAVRRLVVTSSISAYGPVAGEVTEETPSRAAESRVNYQRTKWQAQEIARSGVGRGLEVLRHRHLVANIHAGSRRQATGRATGRSDLHACAGGRRRAHCRRRSWRERRPVSSGRRK